LYVDRAGNVYVQLFEFGEDGPKFSFVRYGPDGVPGDTIQVPAQPDVPMLLAVHQGPDGSSRSSTNVPYWPEQATTLSRDGEFVIGNSASYSIDIPRAGGVLRVQRAIEPVPVLPGEKANRRERTIHNMRQTEPGWDWDGPDIPDTKPAFQQLMIDDDGRLWVYLHSRGEPIPEEEIEEPDPGSDEGPPARWREPVRLDVFEEDGTYLSQLEAPQGFGFYPRPAIDGDRVWAVVRDELDVQYLVRLRIVPEPARP